MVDPFYNIGEGNKRSHEASSRVYILRPPHGVIYLDLICSQP